MRTGRETRTPDTRFWRPVLYQLSYARMERNEFEATTDSKFVFLFRFIFSKSIKNFRNLTGTNRTTSFTDSETQSFVQSNRLNQFNFNSQVIAG